MSIMRNARPLTKMFVTLLPEFLNLGRALASPQSNGAPTTTAPNSALPATPAQATPEPGLLGWQKAFIALAVIYATLLIIIIPVGYFGRYRARLRAIQRNHLEEVERERAEAYRLHQGILHMQTMLRSQTPAQKSKLEDEGDFEDVTLDDSHPSTCPPYEEPTSTHRAPPGFRMP